MIEIHVGKFHLVHEYNGEKPGDEDWKRLENVIGLAATELLQSRGVEMRCDGHEPENYYFQLNQIQFEINEGETRPGRKRKSCSRRVHVGFCRRPRYGLWWGKDVSSDEYRGEVLGRHTLSTLRLMGEVIRNIDPVCEVILDPSTRQRERVFKKFFSRQKNVCIRKAVIDDLTR